MATQHSSTPGNSSNFHHDVAVGKIVQSNGSLVAMNAGSARVLKTGDMVYQHDMLSADANNAVKISLLENNFLSFPDQLLNLKDFEKFLKDMNDKEMVKTPEDLQDSDDIFQQGNEGGFNAYAVSYLDPRVPVTSGYPTGPIHSEIKDLKLDVIAYKSSEEISPAAHLPITDLSLDKSVSDDAPNVGDEITYTLHITNPSEDTASSVLVTDILPPGLEVDSGSISHGGTYDPDTRTITWHFDHLAGGDAIDLHYTVTVSEGVALEEVVNQASVTSITFDSNPDNNDDETPIDPQDADLSINKNVSDHTPNIGDSVNYKLCVFNDGHDTATNVVVTDVLPPGLIINTESISHGGVYDADTRTITWHLSDVAAGEKIDLHYQVLVSTYVNLEQVTNFASVTSDTFDPDLEDNTDTETIDPQDADLSLNKQVNDAAPMVGEDITYTITLHNNGNDLATGVLVQDLLPAGINFISATASHGTYDSNTGLWTVGDIAAGDTYTLQITGLIVTADIIFNTSEVVASDVFDPDSTPNNHNPQEDDQSSVSVDPDDVPTAGTTSAIVDEAALGPMAALVLGTTPVSTAEIVTGNLTYNFGGDGMHGSTPFTWSTTVVASDPEVGPGAISLTSGGAPLVWSIQGGSNGQILLGTASGGAYNGQVIAQVELLNVNTGAYKFTLLGPIDHPDINQSGSNDLINLKFNFDVKDSDGDISTGILNVAVKDDAPIALPEVAAGTDAPQINTNLLLVLDISGSMNEAAGASLTNLTRLDVAKAAINELMEQYNGLGDIAVRIITFSTGAAASGGTWLTLDGAKSVINALSAGGTTNYDAALTTAVTAFGSPGKIAGAENVAYFLSDGQPNQPIGSPGINGAEEGIWKTFLVANDVKAFALGMGSGSVASALDPIAYDGTIGGVAGEMNSIIVTDLSQLTSTLISTIAPPVTGNIITDSGSLIGADQAGFIKSFTVDGITHTGSGTINVTTALGGLLAINMNNGDYTYQPPANLNNNISEAITYVVSDFDGDTASSTLTINITDNDQPPLIRDDSVITNINGGSAAIVIPEWALLYNDTDADGHPISVTGSATNVNEATSVTRAGGNFTFTDNGDEDGGSFNYTGTANSLTDTGLVTINRAQDDSNPLQGTGLGEVLIGRTSNDTINGFGGNDVLIGNDGNDTLNGGEGNDLIDGGLGNDAVTGGAGNDIVNLAQGNDTVNYTTTLDGTDILNNFDGNATGGQDILNLDALLDSLGIGTGARASRVTTVDLNGGTDGPTWEVRVNADNNGGTGTGGYELVVVVIHSPDNITVGSDVTLGNL